MTEREFWVLIETARLRSHQEPHLALEQLLASLAPSEIVAFDQHFAKAFHAAYTWDLWGAAYIIQGGCSDDGFTYFRHGLIAAGEDVYKRAVAVPDSLAQIEQPPEEYEEYGYAADHAYMQKAGVDLPSWHWPVEPTGEHWNFESAEECSKRLPGLSERFL